LHGLVRVTATRTTSTGNCGQLILSRCARMRNVLIKENTSKLEKLRCFEKAR
jgi:hypothetical protein